MMKSAAIFLMGLPGAGKGTQAFALAERFPDFVHFDTGGEIYRRVTDPTYQENAAVQKQRKVYFGGFLNDPTWVSELVGERIRTYSKEGQSLVFSGSPRTLPEAQAVVEVLKETYGLDRVLVLVLEVSQDTARNRSLGRIVCTNKACRYPATRDLAGKPCPNCGTLLPEGEQKEESWKTELLPARFKEYQERTVPAISYISDLGLVRTISGEGSKEEVAQKIQDEIQKRLG